MRLSPKECHRQPIARYFYKEMHNWEKCLSLTKSSSFQVSKMKHGMPSLDSASSQQTCKIWIYQQILCRNRRKFLWRISQLVQSETEFLRLLSKKSKTLIKKKMMEPTKMLVSNPSLKKRNLSLSQSRV